MNLDNPDVRWSYQCYIWQTPIRLIRQLLKYKVKYANS